MKAKKFFSPLILQKYCFNKEEGILLPDSGSKLVKFRLRYDELFQAFTVKDFSKLDGVFCKLDKPIDLPETLLLSIGKIYVSALLFGDSLEIKVYKGKQRLMFK